MFPIFVQLAWNIANIRHDRSRYSSNTCAACRPSGACLPSDWTNSRV